MKKYLLLAMFVIGCTDSPTFSPKATSADAMVRQAKAMERMATAFEKMANEKCECKK